MWSVSLGCPSKIVKGDRHHKILIFSFICKVFAANVAAEILPLSYPAPYVADQ